MHNPKMNQTSIKDRIISGSSGEKIVYFGVVCSHFDFACSSANSNIEPLGIEEAFLKAPFSFLVLPTNSLVCINKPFWLHPPLNKRSVFNAVFIIIKEKMKDKGAILAFQYLWAAALLGEVVDFPPISQCSLPTADLSLPHPQKLHSQSLVFYTLLTISLSLWDKERLKIHRELMCRRETVRCCLDSLCEVLQLFDSSRWKFERRNISTQIKSFLKCFILN